MSVKFYEGGGTVDDHAQFFDLISKLVDKMETRLKDVEIKTFIMWRGGGIILLAVLIPIIVGYAIKKLTQ